MHSIQLLESLTPIVQFIHEGYLITIKQVVPGDTILVWTCFKIYHYSSTRVE